MPHVHYSIANDNPRVGDALKWAANEMAEQIAQFDPWPHTNFLSLSSGRQHYVAYLIANKAEDTSIRAALKPGAWSVLRSDPLGIPSARRAFEKFKMPIWTSREYELVQGLVFADRMKHLCLLKQICPAKIGLMHELSGDLLHRRMALILRSDAEARIVERILCQVAPTERPLMAHKLRQASDRKAFWKLFRSHVYSTYFHPTAPLLDLPEGYEQVKTAKQLESVAREFKNCLRVYQEELMTGELAIVVRRSERKVVLSVKPRTTGLMHVEEIKYVDNEEVEHDEICKILAELATCGIQAPRLDSFHSHVRLDHAIDVVSRDDTKVSSVRRLRNEYRQLEELIDTIELQRKGDVPNRAPIRRDDDPGLLFAA